MPPDASAHLVRRAVLLAVLLAGCASSGSEAPTTTTLLEVEAPPDRSARLAATPEAARVAEVVAMEVRVDGALLRGHVYVPDAPGPHATVLGLGPYWGTEFPATGEMLRDDGLRAIYGDTTYDNLSRAGFAIALFNVRGTGASEGCYHFFDPRDGADASAIIEAIAAMPWSDGAVGMYGVSYDGWTQYAAMTLRPPALRATVPVSGILDPWSVATRHGAISRPYVAAGTLYQALVSQGALALASGAGDASPPAADARRACPDGLRATLQQDAILATGDRNAAFAARDLRGGVRASGIPVLASYGFALAQMPDGRGQAPPFEGLILQLDDLSTHLPEGSVVLAGQWGHGPPTPRMPEFPALVVAWLDHHLRGAPRPALPGAWYEDDAGVWHEARAWPPAAPSVAWELGNGRLASSDRQPAIGPGLPDQLAFVSPPIEAHQVLAGSFHLELVLRSSAPDGNVAAYLFALGDEARELARAHTDLRHRGNLDVGRAFPVGEADVVAVTSGAFATTLHAGERLVLVLAGGDGVELAPEAAKPLLIVDGGRVRLPVVG